MAHIIQLTWEVKGTKLSTHREWGLEGPGPSSLCTEKGGKDDFNFAPIRTTRLAAYTDHFVEFYVVQAFFIASNFD